MSKPDLRGARVVITGERRAEEQAALVRTLNGVPFVCPTVRLAWEDDGDAPRVWIDAVRAGVDDAMFMTGMGCNRLLQHAESAGLLDDVVRQLVAARVVVRGSKALPVLRRHGVPVALNPQPATTEGVLAALHDSLPGRRVVLQLAGPEPSPLAEGMRALGADVVAVCIYRYSPDAVDNAATPLLDAIVDGDVDVVTFTSAPSVEGLVAAATSAGRWDAVHAAMESLVVAAVGPVTADALAGNGVTVHVQPPDDEPRLGAMMRLLAEHLAAARR
jgi:uroporphyrinogen-III synthase